MAKDPAFRLGWTMKEYAYLRNSCIFYLVYFVHHDNGYNCSGRYRQDPTYGVCPDGVIVVGAVLQRRIISERENDNELKDEKKTMKVRRNLV